MESRQCDSLVEAQACRWRSSSFVQQAQPPMVQQVSRSDEDIATGPSILGDVAKSDHNVLSVESRPSAPAFLRPPVMEPACSACRGTSDLSLAQFQIAAKIGGRLGGNAQPFRRHNERSTEARLRQLAKHTAHFLRGGGGGRPFTFGAVVLQRPCPPQSECTNARMSCTASSTIEPTEPINGTPSPVHHTGNL
eukprot:COSAG02_NODE_24924_length_674_cov_0.617391_1_plen_193_part_00